jgi:hypothetical protein
MGNNDRAYRPIVNRPEQPETPGADRRSDRSRRFQRKRDSFARELPTANSARSRACFLTVAGGVQSERAERRRAGRDLEPSAAMIHSQSVKAGVGNERGVHGGEKLKGR